MTVVTYTCRECGGMFEGQMRVRHTKWVYPICGPCSTPKIRTVRCTKCSYVQLGRPYALDGRGRFRCVWPYCKGVCVVHAAASPPQQ